MINVTKFDVLEDKDILCYKLENKNGMSMEVLNFGGVIQSLVFDGTDVVLTHKNAADYMDNDANLGVLVGRNSNRIANAEFTLNGKTYKLAVNNHKGNLHGGIIGFSKKIWDVKPIDGDEPTLILSIVSPDGDEGFPGEAHVQVTYTLTKENSLKIHYEATCDCDTIMNLTNHSYFNLNGADSGTIDNHTFELKSNFFTPTDNEGIPSGEILSVKNTPMDFTSPKKIGPALASDYEQIVIVQNGIDHNFVLDGEGFRNIGTLVGDQTNIKMDVFTDLPGVQVYTANFLTENDSYKNDAKYGKHHGICLETQYFPNAINIPHFVSPILKKGETYSTTTEYKFYK